MLHLFIPLFSVSLLFSLAFHPLSYARCCLATSDSFLIYLPRLNDWKLKGCFLLWILGLLPSLATSCTLPLPPSLSLLPVLPSVYFTLIPSSFALLSTFTLRALSVFSLFGVCKCCLKALHLNAAGCLGSEYLIKDISRFHAQENITVYSEWGKNKCVIFYFARLCRLEEMRGCLSTHTRLTSGGGN